MQISEIKKVLLPLLIVLVSFIAFPKVESLAIAAEIPAPLLPDTGIAEASTTVPVATTTVPATPPAAGKLTQTSSAPIANPVAQIPAQTPVVSDPVLLSIPSLNMQNQIVGVGTNSLGQMDVPSGSTSNVGWYKYGTVPGQVGSAVLDAHVFAAFSKLKNISVGSLLYVKNASGQTLTFRVEEVETYPLADVPPDKLFNRTDKARLNLITCAGKLTADHSTYDHRLVAYAVLVN
jgi:LPXTG-site transpeptidase (sortase) family protein